MAHAYFKHPYFSKSFGGKIENFLKGGYHVKDSEIKKYIALGNKSKQKALNSLLNDVFIDSFPANFSLRQ